MHRFLAVVLSFVLAAQVFMSGSITASAGGNKFSEAAKGAASAAKSTVGGAVQNAKSGAARAANKAKEGASAASSGVRKGASEAASTAKSAASEAADTAKEKASAASSAAKKGTSKAAASAKTAASKASETAKDTAKAASSAAKEGAEKAASGAKNASNKAAASAKSAASKASETAKDTAEAASAAAKEGAATVSRSFVDAENKVLAFASRIDPDKFKKGWDLAAEYGGAVMGTLKGTGYINDVQSSITALRNDINASAGVKRGISQQSGFSAESWHTGTFNIDAAVKGNKSSATRLGSNDLGSVDIQTGDKDYSLKYYDTAEGSAQAQAENYMAAYKKYCSKVTQKGSNPPTPEEYLREQGKTEQVDKMMESLYKGQKRVIPADQYLDAVDYLKRKAAKNSVNPDKAEVAANYKETLDMLADRLEDPKGTQSKPLTKKEAKAIAELSEKGDFDPADFGITLDKLITPKYILKQSIQAGASSAVLEIALQEGPEIYSIFKEAIESGDLDEEKLKKTGIDSAISGSEGFIEGSVSSAIIIACKAGKFGPSMTDVSPNVVAAATVLIVDSARYGYKLANNEISPDQYGDIMTKEVFVAIVSYGAGVGFQTFLPFIPFSYMVGSMVGSMLASVGYDEGKKVVLAIKDGNGYAVFVPEQVTALDNVLNVGDKVLGALKNKTLKGVDGSSIIADLKKGTVSVTL